MKKILSIFLTAAMILGLAACTPSAPAETQDTSAQTQGASAQIQAAAAASPMSQAETDGSAEDVVKALEEAVSKKLYESAEVSVSLWELLEDTEGYHVIMKAENKTAKPLNLEIPAVAFNGITAQNSSGWALPANGDAYLYMNFYKDGLEEAGANGKPGAIKVGVRVYDEDYNRIDEGVCECVLDGANSAAASVPAGKTVYENGGVKITSLGVAGVSDGERVLKICVENNTEEMICLDGTASAAPGEELTASVYGYVLPGTKSICDVSFYSADYSANVDPDSLPFVNMLFRFSYDAGNETVMTDPVKISLGTEKRFTLGEDGTKMELTQSHWIYENCEWVVTSSDKEVLAVESVKSEEGVPAEGRQQVTAVLTAGKPGIAKVTLQYHPQGESLEKTEDTWPTVYCERSIWFRVTEDGKIEPDDITLEIPDLAGESDTGWWYYTFKNDGSLASKDSSAG